MKLFQKREANKHLTQLTVAFALPILLIVGCSGSQINQASTPVPTAVIPSATPTPQPLSTTQKFTIISAYEGMDAYIQAAQTTPDAHLSTLYRQYVVDPFWDDCASGGEYVMLAQDAVARPIQDLDQLANAISILRNSSVEQTVQKALQNSSMRLSGPDTTVCIFIVDPKLTFVRDYMGGVTGMTVGAGKIWVQIYPEGSWIDWVPYTVAHEYHHSVWTDRNQRQTFDLATYLMFEGRADSFAHLAYPEVVAPWTAALTAEQEAAQWQVMQTQLETKSLPIQRKFMFGGADVPRWAGYTIGYQIVQTYLKKHPTIGIDELMALDAQELIEESDYNAEH